MSAELFSPMPGCLLYFTLISDLVGQVLDELFQDISPILRLLPCPLCLLQDFSVSLSCPL